MTQENPTINLAGPPQQRRIGELLIAKGVVTEDQVRIGLTGVRGSDAVASRIPATDDNHTLAGGVKRQMVDSRVWIHLANRPVLQAQIMVNPVQ